MWKLLGKLLGLRSLKRRSADGSNPCAQNRERSDSRLGRRLETVQAQAGAMFRGLEDPGRDADDCRPGINSSTTEYQSGAAPPTNASASLASAVQSSVELGGSASHSFIG